MTAARQLGIREITSAEVELFHEQGWVKLANFLPRELAEELFERIQPRMRLDEQVAAVSPEASQGTAYEAPSALSDIGMWRDYHRPSDDEELFRAVCHSPALGAVVSRLWHNDVAVQASDNTVACKIPRGAAGESGATNWHQDYPSHPFDRAGNKAFWIALAPATPEHGTMRYFNGSHREGPLGRAIEHGSDLLEMNPWLKERYELSEPLSYNPGDATIHHSLTVHGAGVNHAATPRWSYITSYFPADTLYTGAPWPVIPAAASAEPFQPLDRRYFPIVYP